MKKNNAFDYQNSKPGLLFTLIFFTAGSMLYLYMGFEWGFKALQINTFFAIITFTQLIKAIIQSIRLYENDKTLMKDAAAFNPFRTVAGTVISIISGVAMLCMFVPILNRHIEHGHGGLAWASIFTLGISAYSLVSAVRDAMKYWRLKPVPYSW